MPSQVWFFLGIGFALVAWGVVARQYFWPRLAPLNPTDALRPLLTLHSFRFLGLAFLIPGVVAPDLPASFAQSAAYGDLIAAALALLSLALLPKTAGIMIAWVFNLWGTADLFNAFFQANRAGLLPGQLGATYFIPTFIVPLLLVTHWLAFRILLWRQPSAAIARKAGAAT